MRTAFFSIFFVFFLLIGAVSAVQAADSAYDVSGVKVDISDESAVKARNLAFIEAQQKAFQKLAENYKSGEDLKAVQLPDIDTLSNMILDFKIANEQVSDKRYVGVFDFRFKANEANKYFGHGPLNFKYQQEDVYKSILLLPFYHEQGKAVVFNKVQNPFWQSLQQIAGDYPSVILPKGSGDEILVLENYDPTNISEKTTREFLNRYNTQLAFFMMANINFDAPGKITLELFDANNYKQYRGKAMSIAKLDVAAKDVARTAMEIVAQSLENVKKMKSKQLIETGKELSPAEDEIPESIIDPKLAQRTNGTKLTREGRREMIEAAKREQEKSKQAENNQYSQGDGSGSNANVTANDDGSGEMNLKIYFGSMNEWITTQKDLSKVNGIRGIRIVSLKTTEAETVVEYYNWGLMLKSLKENTFALSPVSENSYILKRTSNNF